MPDETQHPMRHCWNCGVEVGRFRHHDHYDTCGARECDRAASDAQEEYRAQAHEQLDRDMGY